MVINREVTSFKRLLRRSHCPNRQRLIAFAAGRDDKELEHLAGLIDQPNSPEDLLILAMRPRIIC